MLHNDRNRSFVATSKKNCELSGFSKEKNKNEGEEEEEEDGEKMKKDSKLCGEGGGGGRTGLIWEESGEGMVIIFHYMKFSKNTNNILECKFD